MAPLDLDHIHATLQARLGEGVEIIVEQVDVAEVRSNGKLRTVCSLLDAPCDGLNWSRDVAVASGRQPLVVADAVAATKGRAT